MRVINHTLVWCGVTFIQESKLKLFLTNVVSLTADRWMGPTIKLEWCLALVWEPCMIDPSCSLAWAGMELDCASNLYRSYWLFDHPNWLNVFMFLLSHESKRWCDGNNSKESQRFKVKIFAIKITSKRWHKDNKYMFPSKRLYDIGRKHEPTLEKSLAQVGNQGITIR